MATKDGTFIWYLRDEHWSRAALPAAVGLLLLSPLLYPTLGLATFLIFLQLPLYMLHQYEEHGHGAFKAFMNRTLLAGGLRLTDRKIFWTNALGVWGVDVCALYLAHYGGSALGLVAPYLAIVNGLVHAAPAARTRRYNPGLWTAIALLLPGGVCAVIAVARAGGATMPAQAIGIGAAILLHAVTFVSMGALDRLHASRPA